MADEPKTFQQSEPDPVPGDSGQRNERRLRLALEAARLGTWEIDLRTNVGTQDRRVAEILGLPLDQTHATPAAWVAMIHPNDRGAIMESFERFIQDQTPYDVQFRIVRSDETVRWLAASARVDFDEADRPLRIYGVVADITEQKQAEQSLRESEEKYRSIFETAGNLIIAVDDDGTIVDCNQRIETVLGYRREEIVGESMGRIVHPEDLAGVQEALHEIGEPGRSHRGEYRMVRKDGQVIQVSISSTIRKGRGAVGPRTICIIEDITEYRRFVEALRKRDEELQTLNTTLEQRVAERTAIAEERAAQLRRLAGQLTQAEQQERRRVAHILHEHFQQLLVGARLNLSILRSDLADSKYLESIRQVDAALGEAIDATRSLTIELSPPILYEAGLAEALAWLGRWMQERHGLEVRVQADPIADPPAEDVRIALFAAVRELLFNVVKHAGVNHVAVSMNLGDDRRTRITVADAGVGFDPEQVDQTGGGFGLFSIRERLAMLGGRLEIQSAPGRGTRALLLGPLPPAAAAGARKISVLIADDHAIVRDGLVSLLQGYPDVEVVGQAAEGRQAVELTRQLQPDVVIMDVSMPGMNGIEATRQIVEQGRQVRVIGLSMHIEADMAEAMRQAGVARYLTKSGPPEDLIAAIRACVADGDVSTDR